MTSTATTPDTLRRRFAHISARYVGVDDHQDGIGPITYATCGHDDPNCRAIKSGPGARMVDAPSVMEHLEANEFFDGEVAFLPPIVCKVCAR